MIIIIINFNTPNIATNNDNNGNYDDDERCLTNLHF